MKQSLSLKTTTLVGIMFLIAAGSTGCATLKKSAHPESGEESHSVRKEYLNQPNIKRLIIGRSERGDSDKEKGKNGKRDEEKFEDWKESYSHPLSPHVPLLEEPKIKTIWVEDQIIGRKYVEGHFVHILEEAAKWKK